MPAFPFAGHPYPSISPSVLKPILQISLHLRSALMLETALTRHGEGELGVRTEGERIQFLGVHIKVARIVRHVGRQDPREGVVDPFQDFPFVR